MMSGGSLGEFQGPAGLLDAGLPGGVLLQWSGHRGLLETLLWFGVLLVVVTFGVAVLSWYRRIYWRGWKETSTGLTLDDLRRHHQQGRLTSAEYDALRKTLLSGTKVDRPE